MQTFFAATWWFGRVAINQAWGVGIRIGVVRYPLPCGERVPRCKRGG